MTKLETMSYIIEDKGGELIIIHKHSGCEISVNEVEDDGDNYDHLNIFFANSKVTHHNGFVELTEPCVQVIANSPQVQTELNKIIDRYN